MFKLTPLFSKLGKIRFHNCLLTEKLILLKYLNDFPLKTSSRKILRRNLFAKNYNEAHNGNQCWARSVIKRFSYVKNTKSCLATKISFSYENISKFSLILFWLLRLKVFSSISSYARKILFHSFLFSAASRVCAVNCYLVKPWRRKAICLKRKRNKK